MKRLNYLCLVGLLFVSAASAARGETIEWVRQLGTSGPDDSWGVSADGLGNVYISGQTNGSLGGPSAGFDDAFVSKYDAAGTLQWSRQLGTSTYDYSYGVSADGLGNVYISGSTQGSLGGPNAGSSDAFVSKYDAAGTLQWSRQLGTSSSDSGKGVSADGLGNVYISGSTAGSLGGPNAGDRDAYVSKYDAAGTLQWSRQLGTSPLDFGRGVSADGLGNVYISGVTFGSLGGPSAGSYDAFVSKYDAAGTLQWSRQLGTSDYDESLGVSADGLGNVYISGYTRGSLGGPNAGDADAFVSKYDAAGTFQWSRQLGTSSFEASVAVSADGLGNVYISGNTDGSLGGPFAGGPEDVFVSKYDAAGTLQWTQQLGTSTDDYSSGVSADGLGNVYFSGYTTGSLGGPNAGGVDAFVAKISDPAVPEPSTFLLTSAALGLCIVQCRRRAQNRVVAPLLALSVCIAALFGLQSQPARADSAVAWGNIPGGMDSGVTAVAAGGNGHNLAVQNGAVYAWGYNGSGQLGDGTMTTRLTPVPVSGMASDVTIVAAGGCCADVVGHSLAVQNGALYAWGYNSAGQLGDGTKTTRLTPVPVSGMGSGVTAIAAGVQHSLAIQNGGLWAWGSNSSGALGNGTFPTGLPPINASFPTPAPVIGLTSGVTAISAGQAHSLAVKDGGVYAWGSNNFGQLGHGSTGGSSHTPELVAGLESGVTAVAAGETYSLAVAGGHAYVWNDYTSGTPVPVDPTNLSNIVAVAAGSCCTAYALSSEGSLWTWDSQDSYPTPNSLHQLLPPTGYKFTSIAAGYNHAVATLAAVPEPSTFLLAAAAFAGLLLPRRAVGRNRTLATQRVPAG